jgi:hypothetical protein
VFLNSRRCLADVFAQVFETERHGSAGCIPGAWWNPGYCNGRTAGAGNDSRYYCGDNGSHTRRDSSRRNANQYNSTDNCTHRRRNNGSNYGPDYGPHSGGNYSSNTIPGMSTGSTGPHNGCNHNHCGNGGWNGSSGDCARHTGGRYSRLYRDSC